MSNNANEILLGPRRRQHEQPSVPTLAFDDESLFDPTNPEHVRRGKCLPPRDLAGYVDPLSIWLPAPETDRTLCPPYAAGALETVDNLNPVSQKWFWRGQRKEGELGLVDTIESERLLENDDTDDGVDQGNPNEVVRYLEGAIVRANFSQRRSGGFGRGGGGGNLGTRGSLGGLRPSQGQTVGRRSRSPPVRQRQGRSPRAAGPRVPSPLLGSPPPRCLARGRRGPEPAQEIDKEPESSSEKVVVEGAS